MQQLKRLLLGYKQAIKVTTGYKQPSRSVLCPMAAMHVHCAVCTHENIDQHDAHNLELSHNLRGQEGFKCRYTRNMPGIER